MSEATAERSTTPTVFKWFIFYCVLTVAAYALLAAVGVWGLTGTTGGPSLVYIICTVFGVPLASVYATATVLPRRPWVWVFDLVLICLGLTSVGALPLTLPLFLYWIKPETRAWFDAPAGEPAVGPRRSLAYVGAVAAVLLIAVGARLYFVFRNPPPELSLHDAAQRGMVADVEAYLARKADVNEVSGDRTPLLAAAQLSVGTDTMRLLLEAGADPNLAVRSGERPLHRAAGVGNVDAVALLIKHGADPNALSNGATTPLMAAAERGHKEVVGLLLRHGAKIEARDQNDRSALTWAIQLQDLQLMALLVEKGAELNPAGRLSAVRYARTNYKPVAEQWLKARGAKE